jgi:hypothetical protein
MTGTFGASGVGMSGAFVYDYGCLGGTGGKGTWQVQRAGTQAAI